MVQCTTTMVTKWTIVGYTVTYPLNGARLRNNIALRRLRSKSVGGKPAARKTRGHSIKTIIGDDRYFVSALEQGFGPAFFFVLGANVTFRRQCPVMGYFVYHRQLSVARGARNSALQHV